MVVERIQKYARGESNPNRWNRNPLFYPLNYGRISIFQCKITKLISKYQLFLRVFAKTVNNTIFKQIITNYNIRLFFFFIFALLIKKIFHIFAR